MYQLPIKQVLKRIIYTINLVMAFMLELQDIIQRLNQDQKAKINLNVTGN